MKLSYYNEKIVYLDKYYIYNLYRNSLVCVSKDVVNKLESSAFDLLNPLVLKQLKDNGIIIDSEKNELEEIRFFHNGIKYDANQCSYIIYPTLTCNLSCPYCFEKTERKRITNKNMSILEKYLYKQATNPKYSFMHIRWSGGEPLLLWKQIKRINFEILNACKSNKIEYSSSLCTNATLLTDAIALDINEMNISPVTVSIDGPRFIHNKRRFYKKNEGSFDDVIFGINSLSKYQKVTLRLNIDRYNYEYYEDLLLELNEILIYKDNIYIYIKPVIPAYDCALEKSMYDNLTFNKIELSLLEKTKEYGFKMNIHPGFNHYTRCVMYQVNSFLIDPQLFVYKCPLHLGQSHKRIGYINEDAEMIIEKQDDCIMYTNMSPFDNEECRKCKVLPLCSGKCPELWKKSGFKENEGCIPEKETIVPKMENFLIPEILKKYV